MNNLIARTLAPMTLVFSDNDEDVEKALGDGRLREPYLRVSTERDLKPYHLRPVQNCTLLILTQHPLLTTPEFLRLRQEKAH